MDWNDLQQQIYDLYEQDERLYQYEVVFLVPETDGVFRGAHTEVVTGFEVDHDARQIRLVTG